MIGQNYQQDLIIRVADWITLNILCEQSFIPGYFTDNYFSGKSEKNRGSWINPGVMVPNLVQYSVARQSQ